MFLELQNFWFEPSVSLDALFKGATPVLGQSTPNSAPPPPAENGSNAEKTTKLKSLFGIKDTEQQILAQPIYRYKPYFEVLIFNVYSRAHNFQFKNLPETYPYPGNLCEPT